MFSGKFIPLKSNSFETKGQLFLKVFTYNTTPFRSWAWEFVFQNNFINVPPILWEKYDKSKNIYALTKIKVELMFIKTKNF